MFPALLLTSLLCTPASEAAPLLPSNARFQLDVDESRWSSQLDGVGGKVIIQLSGKGNGRPAVFGVFADGPQPDVGGRTDEELQSWTPYLLPYDMRGVIELKAARAERPPFGTILTARGQGLLDGAPVDARVLLIPAADGLVEILAIDVRGSATLDQRLDEIIAGLTLDHPQVPIHTLPNGHLAMEAGYELDLPAGWRGLGTHEDTDDVFELVGVGIHQSARARVTFVRTDDRPLDGSDDRLMGCRAIGTLDEPTQVLDPARDPAYASNFLNAVHVLAEGGALLSDGRDGSVEVLLQVEEGAVPIEIEPGAVEEVRLVMAGDRPAYRWDGDGTRDGVPIRYAAFYTSYDDVELYCFGLGPIDDDRFSADFEATMATLRVTDGERHPMADSLRTRYLRWWPFPFPAIELPWLGILGVLGVSMSMMVLGIARSRQD